MRSPRPRPAVVALAAAAALVAGCTGASTNDGRTNDGNGDDDQAAARTVRPGAPGEDGEVLDGVPERGSTSPNEADLAFVADMLIHHEQALVMTALVDQRTAHDTLPLLAERIEVSQEAEIAMLEEYLAAHEVEPHHGSGHHDPHDGMPGMLSDQEIDQLRAADGADFDRRFLEAMVRHHVGAVEMVDAYAAAGGQDLQVERLAGHLRAEQESEIRRMEQVLAQLDDG